MLAHIICSDRLEYFYINQSIHYSNIGECKNCLEEGERRQENEMNNWNVGLFIRY